MVVVVVVVVAGSCWCLKYVEVYASVHRWLMVMMLDQRMLVLLL